MAADNKTLGRFQLVGILPAPRGVPQIEVTFEIDTNGIVHVSAKDLGTGKEQSIRVTAQSGLTQEEIDRIIAEAEAHKEEDLKRKELVDARNQAIGLVYTVQNSLKEFGQVLAPDERDYIQQCIDYVNSLMESNDCLALKQATEQLSQASHRLAEAVYAQASQQAQEEVPLDTDEVQE
jgi:molecular chaperone DnaK